MMVEAYLNEVYILKERCDAYRTKIIRAYRKDTQAAAFQKVLNNLGRVTADSLSPLSAHEARMFIRHGMTIRS